MIKLEKYIKRNVKDKMKIRIINKKDAMDS